MLRESTKQKYIARLTELIEQGNKIPIESKQVVAGTSFHGEKHYRTEKYLPFNIFVQWKTSCITVLDAVVPKSSLHRSTVDQFSSLKNEPSSQEYGVAFIKSIAEDFENGFFEDLESQIDAEITTDYLHQAEQLLVYGKTENNSNIPAAILAGAVLEHGLRTIANKLGPTEAIDDKGRPLMLGALIELIKKHQVYNELTAKQLRHWADIRNAAAHGNFADFDHTQVKAMVSGISDFLARYQL